MSDPARGPLYLGGAALSLLLVPLACLAAARSQATSSGSEVQLATENLRLVAADGLADASRERALAGIPADPERAWLVPVIRAELLGEAPPGVPGDPAAERLLALYRTPSPSPRELRELLDRSVPEIPYPFLRLRLTARAQKLIGGAAEAEATVELVRRALSARIVVISSYFTLLLLAGVALLLRAALGTRSTPTTVPAIPARDGWGLFGTWLGLHLLAMAIASALPLSDRGRLLATGTLYVGVGGGILLLGGPLVARPLGLSLRALLGMHGSLAGVAWGVAGLCAAVPLVTAAYLVASALGVKGSSQSNMISLLVADDGVARAAVLVLVSAAAPLVEEGIFRGLLLPSMLHRMPRPVALVLNALLFGLAHFDPAVLLPLCALGAVLAWLRAHTGSLVPGMVAHGLWNLQTVLLVTLLLGPVHGA